MTRKGPARRCSASTTGVLLVLLLAAGTQAAHAASALVSGSAASVSIDVKDPAPAREVLRDITASLGIALHGDPGEDMVSRRRIENSSLQAALQRIIPKKPFVLRYESGSTAPVSITFLGGESSAMTATTGPLPYIDSSNAAGVPVPVEDRARFVGSLPMLRTH